MSADLVACAGCGWLIERGEDCPFYGSGETHAAVSPANEKTIDGVPLTPGMKVWDYDLRPAYVIELHHVAQDGTAWYRTTRSPDGTGAWNLFDAQRMWHRHPSTGVLA